MDDEIITFEFLKNKYYDNKNKLDYKTQMLNGAKNDLIKLNLECISTQHEMNKSINRLKEIALNKSVYESVEEHIDELIMNEKNEHKEGWQIRVNGLQILKEQKKKLREISQGNNEDFEKIKKFIEDLISNEENLKQFTQDLDNNKTGNNNNCLIF